MTGYVFMDEVFDSKWNWVKNPIEWPKPPRMKKYNEAYLIDYYGARSVDWFSKKDPDNLLKLLKRTPHNHFRPEHLKRFETFLREKSFECKLRGDEWPTLKTV